MTNDLALLNRGTAQGAGDGDTGWEGSEKLINNFAELDQRTRSTTAFKRVVVPVNFETTSELVRLVNGLNSMPQQNVEARKAYLLITTRVVGQIGISATSGTFTTYTRVYALSTELTFGETIGAEGTFQFTSSNLSYQLLSETITQVVDGQVTGNSFLDLGNIGSVSIASAVNGVDPQVPITGAPFLIKSNDGVVDNFHFYVGSELALGAGIITQSIDYVELDPSDPEPIINQTSYVVVRVFGHTFQLRKDPTNIDPEKISVLETNDIILNGFNIDSTEFWSAAKYIGTDPENDIDLPESYQALIRSKLS